MFWQRIASICIGLLWGLVAVGLLYALGTPPWLYMVIGFLTILLAGLDHWRAGHPEPRPPVDTRPQHSLCGWCWIDLSAKVPMQLLRAHQHVVDRCCGCGRAHSDGIYVQVERRFTHCEH